MRESRTMKNVPPTREVGELRARETGSAVAILCRAFAADPVLTHLFRGRRRGPAYRLLFADVVFSHRAFGHAYALREQGRLIGVALWSPPDPRPPTPIGRLRSRVLGALRGALCPSASRALADGFERLQHLHPHEPHWYLAFVGVEPAHQGKGLGAELLAPVLTVADDQRQLAYLETPFPGTHAFYGRLGFKVTGDHLPFVGAPPIWTLERRPGP